MTNTAPSLENATLTIRARILPISSAFLSRAREGFDDLGQPVRRLVAEGGEPLRDVLRRALPGEELILASHSPFSKEGPFKEYGPVYLLADPSGEMPAIMSIVVGETWSYLRGNFVIRAYSREEDILDAALVEAEDAQEVVDRFFARPEVSFLHARFPTYGCFALRIERF